MSGVTFGNKHSYTDFNIYLTDVSIGLPTPVRYKVDVPGANGSLDMTDNITPHIRYKNRNIKLSFKYAGEFEDWIDQETEIADYLHGKRMRVILDDDEDYYWDAFCTIDTFKSDRRIGTLVINCDCFPYKYYLTENSYTVNGNGTITCVVDRMEISPAFEIEAPTTVIYSDSSYVISSSRTIEKTASGDPISVDDGTANPVVDLTANIEAVQDLHGYDYPWVGGAGKNLIPLRSDAWTTNTVSYTPQSDGTLKINGTDSGSSAHLEPVTPFISLPAGTYIFSFSGMSAARVRDSNDNNVVSTNEGTFTLSAPTSVRVLVTIINGTAISNAIFKTMIRKSTESSDWQPYENICPISGWSEVDINVRGKNFLYDVVGHTNPTTINGVTFTQNSDGSITMNGTTTASTLYYLSNRSATPNGQGVVLPKGTYTLSGIPTGYSSVNLRLGCNRGADSSTLGNDTGSGFTFTESDGGTQYGVWIGVNSGATFNNVIVYPMIRLSTDSSRYEPYNGQTYTIDLDSTVYGGMLDVTTGLLTVTHRYVELSTYTWTPNWSGTPTGVFYTQVISYAKASGDLICDSYKVVSDISPNAMDNGCIIMYSNVRLYIKNTDYTDGTTLKSSLSGKYIVCELATPTTVQLTPQQVRTLLGINNIWADSGSINVTYRAQDFEGMKFYIPELEMTEGSHSLTIQGTGTTKVTYTNGRL